MINFPFPTQVHFSYVVSGMEHKTRVGVNVDTLPTVSTDFSTGLFLKRDGTTVDMKTGFQGYLDLIKKNFNSGVIFGGVELWEYPEQSYDGVLRAADSSIGALGTSGSATVLASQMTFSLISAEGNSMRIVSLETIFGHENGRQQYAALGADNKAIVDFVMGDDNFLIAKDGSMPIAFRTLFYGQNEVTFKKRYRQ